MHYTIKHAAFIYKGCKNSIVYIYQAGGGARHTCTAVQVNLHRQCDKNKKKIRNDLQFIFIKA